VKLIIRAILGAKQMPYIKPEKRPVLDGLIKTLWNHCTSPGDFNYVITKLLHIELESTGLSYGEINEAVGVLECAKLELYRMIAVPYENDKIMDNGLISKLDCALNSDKRPRSSGGRLGGDGD